MCFYITDVHVYTTCLIGPRHILECPSATDTGTREVSQLSAPITEPHSVTKV